MNLIVLLAVPEGMKRHHAQKNVFFLLEQLNIDGTHKTRDQNFGRSIICLSKGEVLEYFHSQTGPN